MTLEKYLERMYALVGSMNEEDKHSVETFTKMGITDTTVFSGVAAEAAAIINNLKADILAQEQKSSGKNKQIQACKKILKAFHFDFGADSAVVNVEYLILILEALPNAEVYTYSQGSAKSLYFKSGESEAILCGIRPPEGIRSRTEI